MDATLLEGAILDAHKNLMGYVDREGTWAVGTPEYLSYVNAIRALERELEKALAAEESEL